MDSWVMEQLPPALVLLLLTLEQGVPRQLFPRDKVIPALYSIMHQWFVGGPTPTGNWVMVLPRTGTYL